eukprot:TRINITY_DN109567_c0_g1_i1.p1 TRINITY_DN109567_c0_g1~~TRINITY_DN109567_c0_g1_i1.p1  ORF type:complete len:815 (-),score=144.52 TRINITY_DN109567_c0_g1_i1:394-2751(-)
MAMARPQKSLLGLFSRKSAAYAPTISEDYDDDDVIPQRSAAQTSRFRLTRLARAASLGVMGTRTPSMGSTVHLPKLGQLRGWMKTLARQPTIQRIDVQPAVDDDLVIAEFSDYKANRHAHQFLHAFIAGDLEALEACLNQLNDDHGDASFVALAKDGKVTLKDWLHYFMDHGGSRRGRSMHYRHGRAQRGGQAENAGMLGRTFELLRILTTAPRLQLGEQRPEEAMEEISGKTLYKVVVFRDLGATKSHPKFKKNGQGKKGSSSAKSKESAELAWLIFADFQEARSQVRRALNVSRRLVRGTSAADTVEERMERGSSIKLSEKRVAQEVEAALDSVSPTVRILRAALRHARQGFHSEVCEELQLVWSLFSLEPKVTLEACVSANPPAAHVLGQVVRSTARAMLRDSGGPTKIVPREIIDTMAAALNLCAEIMRVSKYIVAEIEREKLEAVEKTKQSKKTNRLKAELHSHGEKFVTLLGRVGKHQGSDVKSKDVAKLVTEKDSHASQFSPEAVLRQIRERTLVLAMLPFSLCSSDAPALSALLAVTWQILDACNLPQKEVMKPLLDSVAEACGFTQKIRAASLTRSRTRDEISGQLRRPAHTPLTLQSRGRQQMTRVVKPENTPQANEAIEELIEALNTPDEKVAEQRKIFTALYGGSVLVEWFAQEQLRLAGPNDVTRTCLAGTATLADLIQPVMAKMLSSGVVAVTPCPADAPSRARHKQICADPELIAQVREARRSMDYAAEHMWFEMLRGEKDSDDESDSKDRLEDLEKRSDESAMETLIVP